MFLLEGSITVFDCTLWLVGSQFSDQGLNPGPHSESVESQPLGCQKTPKGPILQSPTQQYPLLAELWHAAHSWLNQSLGKANFIIVLNLYFFIIFVSSFICSCAGSLWLCGLCSSGGEQGLPSSCGVRLLIAMPSPVAQHRLQGTQAQQLQLPDSRAQA